MGLPITEERHFYEPIGTLAAGAVPEVTIDWDELPAE